MALVGKSLDSVSAVGVGQIIAFDTPKSKIAMQVTFSGSGGHIILEGTIDGITFREVGGFDLDSSGRIMVAAAQFVPLIAVRANLETLSGASNVTATIAAEQ